MDDTTGHGHAAPTVRLPSFQRFSLMRKRFLSHDATELELVVAARFILVGVPRVAQPQHHFRVVHSGRTKRRRPRIPSHRGNGDLGGEAIENFNTDTDTVLIDYAAVLHDSDLETNTPTTAPGCQSQPFDPDCGPLFKNIGLPHMGEPAGDQVLFKKL